MRDLPKVATLPSIASEVDRAAVEAFLVDEAALLDDWKLEEWLKLIAADGRYRVPALDSPDSDHRKALFLIDDDRRNLDSRVRQLLGRSVWAEHPRSRTRRLISNTRVVERTADAMTVTANFAVWRFQHEVTDCYVGRYVHVLVQGSEGLLFRERKAVLDLETLRPHGKLSFIL